MKLLWMEGAVNATEKHICVIDDAGQVGTICGHRWLQQPVPAAEATARCPDCSRIDTSGEAITATNYEGRTVVLRPALKPVHKGTLDPFQDIVEKLQELRCAYVLAVGLQGEARSHWWTNAAEFGMGGIATLSKSAGDALIDAAKKVKEIERGY
jgi:hypothetical protein